LEAIFKAVGGWPGVLACAATAVAIFWRVKFPQIGIDYLTRELEIHRKEIAESDKDRVTLRQVVRDVKEELSELEKRYLHVLSDREHCRRHIRQLERQLRTLGHEPVPGEEERG